MYSFNVFNSLSLVTAKWYIYYNQSSLFIEKPFQLLRPQSFSFHIVWEFILISLWILCLKGGAFDSLLIFVPRWGFLCTMIIPGERFLLPFKSCPGFVAGGGRLDEIDTCVCHRYVKSDIARPTSVDQVDHSHRKTTFRRRPIGMSI